MADPFADELLALAGESDVKSPRKRTASGSKSSSNKRRKQEMVASDSDMEESEDEGYPLDGKYKDEEDRQRLANLPEIEREQILSKRMDEMQKDIERKKLEKMVKSQSGGATVNGAGVAKAAKRKHTTMGSTKEKTMTLEALKQKRQAKESRRANQTRESESPVPRRQRSHTPSSVDESEEGQIPKGSKASDNSSLDGVQLKSEERLNVRDLNKARITRDMLERQCFSNQFEEFVKGGWVRLVVGLDGDEMIYRICEIVDIASDLVEPYELNNKKVNQLLELRHGSQTRAFPMSKISCGAFTQREFDRLVRTFETDRLKLPTKAKLEKKAEVIHNIESRIRTDADISAALARARDVDKKRTNAELFAEKASLNTRRTLALKKHDKAEVASLDAQIERVEMEMKGQQAVNNTNIKVPNGLNHALKPTDALARVNERNRRANLEHARKAEIEMAARRKKEALMGVPGVQDLSARVKTVVKTTFDSRAGTPGVATVPSPEPAAITPVVMPSAPVNSKIDVMAQSVVIDDLF